MYELGNKADSECQHFELLNRNHAIICTKLNLQKQTVSRDFPAVSRRRTTGRITVVTAVTVQFGRRAERAAHPTATEVSCS
ncbi:hypothetical protein ATANTOWER_015506 [Ataeniobius toweri]|uniref:Uncharacterized protein n=1 Tax=Ataeniobius toweri TaxID=208326 RepID=A0ABU7BQQ3_9TELE|nr:hypothetical protein [Ataeniobius toweri]